MPSSIQSKQKIAELKKRGLLCENDLIQYVNAKKVVFSNKAFKFDRVFRHEENGDCVFQEFEELTQSFLDGYNVCIFAYGQTGSGKTHTMQELNKRITQMVFQQTQHVLMSCFEIHIETVRDLISPQNTNTNLMTNLKWKPTEMTVNDAEDVERLIQIAGANRTIAKTELNACSSRSHCIFQLTIGDAKLNLIDLAGSEKINQSKVEGV